MQDERQYVVETITAFLNGTGGPWDWRAFRIRSLRDVELDRIRQCADAIPLPLDADGRAMLLALLEQAELVDDAHPVGPKVWRMETGAVVGLLLGCILWWVYYLPGASLFHNLHLLIVPAALGAFVVTLRNSRMKVGAYDPRIVDENKRGRV